MATTHNVLYLNPTVYLNVVRDRIVQQFSPLRVILFGSKGRGEGRDGNDLELLIVLPAVENKRQAAIEIRRALGDLPVAKDIVVTTPEEIALRGHLVGSRLREALTEGTVVYERTEPGVEALRWLRFAREDLRTAEMLVEHKGFVPRHACWLAQQTAEKALKAVLVLLQTPFSVRHDLDALRNLIPDGWQVKSEHPDLAMLSEWGGNLLYPGDCPDLGTDDARAAIAEAQAVLESIYGGFIRNGVKPNF